MSENIEAIKKKAREALRNADFLSALHLLQPLITEQDPDILSSLSMIYDTGVAGVVDTEKALELLVRASDLGDGNATYTLAIKYLPSLSPEIPRFVPEDRQRAEQLYLKAKSQGAIIPYLSHFEYFDPSVPLSARQAEHLQEGVQAFLEGSFERAAAFFLPFAVELADPVAQLVVAKLYHYSLGLPKDEAEALKWYKRAAEAGNGDASYHLALIYFEGKCGVDLDGDEYARWIGKAKEQGFLTEECLIKRQNGEDVKLLRAFSVIPIT